MKKILFLLLLLSSTSAFAQDVIVKKDGSTILSKVIEIGTSEVKYKKFSNQNGPSYTIQIADILSINYQNGEKEEFGDNINSGNSKDEVMRNQLTSSNNSNNSNYNSNNANTTVTNTSTRLSPGEYSYFGLSYTADFDYAGDGIYGFSGHAFGTKGFGGSLSIGWNFKNNVAVAKLGPNFCAPISESVFFYVPLYAALNYYTDSGKDKFKFGVELAPSIGFKYKKFIFAVGAAFGWTSGADKIGTGFVANIGFTI